MKELIPGTSPTFTVKVPFDLNLIDKVRIIFAQNDVQKVVKEKEDCKLKDGVIEVVLTQEETFKFNPKFPMQAQARVLTADGTALSTNVRTYAVCDVLCKEVLSI